MLFLTLNHSNKITSLLFQSEVFERQTQEILCHVDRKHSEAEREDGTQYATEPQNVAGTRNWSRILDRELLVFQTSGLLQVKNDRRQDYSG